MLVEGYCLDDSLFLTDEIELLTFDYPGLYGRENCKALIFLPSCPFNSIFSFF